MHNLSPLRFFSPSVWVLVGSMLVLWGCSKSEETSNPHPLFEVHFEIPPNGIQVNPDAPLPEEIKAAITAFNQGDYETAYAQFEKGIEKDPSSNSAYISHFYSGLSAMKLGKPSDAETHLSKLAGEQGGNTTGSWYLALAALQKNDITSAKGHLQDLTGFQNSYTTKAKSILAELENAEK